jgi:hypothetical protein
VAEWVRRVDNRRVEYLRGLFGALSGDETEVEARCLMALSLWIGNHFLAADHEGRSRCGGGRGMRGRARDAGAGAGCGGGGGMRGRCGMLRG